MEEKIFPAIATVFLVSLLVLAGCIQATDKADITPKSQIRPDAEIRPFAESDTEAFAALEQELAEDEPNSQELEELLSKQG